MNICTIVFTIMLIIGAYTSINHSQTQQNEYNVVKQATSKVPYYKLTKDGKAIKFTLKDDKSEYLQKQAEAKIIDEDNKTYQIQYKDTIDRVPKSAVK